MAKKKPPKINVQAPEFQSFPGLSGDISRQRTLAGQLERLDFSGDLAGLQQNVELDPNVTGLALESAKGQLLPEFERQRQGTVNRLANLGALESSTTSSAFAEADENLGRQFQGITAQAALEDRSRALANRIALFGAGLDLRQQAVQGGLQSQGQLNDFNLSNFENKIAAAQLNKPKRRGGLAGGLTGAVGGGLAGFAIGGPVGAGVGAVAGGLAGAFGTSGTGGQILSAGSKFGTPTRRAAPGSTAGAGRKLREGGAGRLRGQLDLLDPGTLAGFGRG